MPERSRLAHAVLVNWRGVFYQHYELDRFVTALEGVNGAGKTTVMIAMYVALMPDLRHLHFSNVGEDTGRGGDRGLYGRLGQPGPAYTALDVALTDGTRLVAGVHLERRTFPNLELSPFLVDGLGPDVPLHRLFLVEEADGHERVPEPDEVRAAAARMGARLRRVNTRDYFRELFERGVSPLDLSRRDARRKMDQMLRTSMMGGISRHLAHGLRDYLLQADRTMGNTVRLMQDNLEACRQTRRAVNEARQTRQEVHSVFQHGERMFAAAVWALKGRRDESRRALETARGQVTALRAACETLTEEVGRLRGERESALAEVERVGERLQDATQRVREAERAAQLEAEIERLGQRLTGLVEAETEATSRFEQAGAQRSGRRQERRRRMARQQEIADRLASAELAWEDVARRAALYREAMEARALARVVTQRPALDAADVGRLLAELTAARDSCAVELDRLQRRLRTAAAHEQRFGVVARAVAQLMDVEHVAPGEALALADRALARLRDARERVRRLPGLRSSRDEAVRLATAQRAAVVAAEALGGVASAARAREVHALSRTATLEARERLARIHRERDDVDAEQADLGGRLEALRGRAARWARVQREARALSAQWQLELASGEALAEALRVLDERYQLGCAGLEAARGEATEQRAAIAALRSRGGAPDPRLLEARDHVAGRLVSEVYDDVPVEDAAALEARLGPLRDALVVDDPVAAARALAGVSGRPDDVYLISGAVAPAAGERVGDAVWVGHAGQGRLTRLPAAPVIGHAAREARIAEHGRRAAAVERRAEGLEEEVAELAEGRGRLLALGRDAELLDVADPEADVAAALERLEQLGRRSTRLLEEGAAGREALRRCGAHEEAAAALLPMAHLLDPPDHGERAAQLEAAVAEAVRDAGWLTRSEAAAAVVEAGREELREVPLDAEAVGVLRREEGRLSELLETLSAGARALGVLDRLAEALTWGDAERVLGEHRSALTALRDEASSLERGTAEATEAERVAEAAFDEAEGALREARAAADRVRGQEANAASERAGLGDVPWPAGESLAAWRLTVGELEAAVVSGRGQADRALADLSRVEQRLANGVEARSRAEADLVSVEAVSGPTERRWAELEASAGEAGLLERALGGDYEVLGEKSAATLNEVAVERRRELIARLQAAADGGEVAALVEASDGEAGGGAAAGYLGAWLAVRGWLLRRVPKDIAESDDPLVALDRLARRMETLERRLADKERELRQSSESIANAIHSKVRLEINAVRRLNGDLEAVSFGSIDGLRLRAERVPAMERLLEALREQRDLFRQDMPVEEALEQIFTEVGGGRIKGADLLDHRRYLEVRVEVLRSDARWQVADPSRMSTGEAIGVGAAVLMVVLRAWEKDARLLRDKRAGSLRFLFLDEANRLSSDNIGVIFDMCRRLELQLVMAAPEVARGEGCTTYRLERTRDEGGAEIVQVVGRRVRRRGE